MVKKIYIHGIHTHYSLEICLFLCASQICFTVDYKIQINTFPDRWQVKIKFWQYIFLFFI